MTKEEEIVGLKELLRIDSYLINVTSALIRDFDARLAEAEQTVQAAIKAKIELVTAHNNAPTKLRFYQADKIRVVRRLKELESKDDEIASKQQKILKLRERIAKLEKELAK